MSSWGLSRGWGLITYLIYGDGPGDVSLAKVMGRFSAEGRRGIKEDALVGKGGYSQGKQAVSAYRSGRGSLIEQRKGIANASRGCR